MPEANTVTKCHLSYCDRESTVMARTAKVKVCASHYNQDWAGKPFTPLRVNKHLHRDDNGRVCTQCEEYKEWSEFYDRSPKGTGKQQRCKVCMIAAASKRQAERNNERKHVTQ